MNVVRKRRGDREAMFWDEHVPSLEQCFAEYKAGPQPNTQLLLDAAEPLADKRVLDFACGAGVIAAWLHDRGARVTALDISPRSTARAKELCRKVGADVSFVTGDVHVLTGQDSFDAIVGRYALHHVDCAEVAPALAARLRPGGRAAFLETMALNPVLRVARRHVVGRCGVPRFGTPDERPLGRSELELLEETFGELKSEVAEMRFFRIFDRQVLRYGSRRATRILGAMDDLLLRAGLGKWSYHQVLVLGSPRE